jgi:energy-coupling factor transporter ATP-binding protein EcfA2
MALPYRSTPVSTLEELQTYYGSGVTISQTRFGQELAHANSQLKEIIRSDKYKTHGIVVSIEGTWGSGKSSFVQILSHLLKDENIALIKYDSLYYGNVSEATDIFIKSIFEEVKDRFGIKLADGSSISKNITPKFELSNGFPKFGLDFKANRQPTEVVKEKLEKSLANLPGKMVVVIDDIDRVAEEDVVHFLRLVRVLRELPNFIVLLPIDRLMLENLLKTQGIENPKRYLEKIIDEDYDINPEQGNSKDLFRSLLNQKYPDETLTDDFLNIIWDLYLWEISLATIKEYERSGQQPLILNMGSTDPTWQVMTPTQSESGELLVRKFMELTSMNYVTSAPNYVLRIKNTANPAEDVYQHYSQVFANMTFTDMMYGRFFLNLGTELQMDTNGLNMMNTRWWDDKESGIVNLQNDPNKTQKMDYRLPIPPDEASKSQYFTDMNNKAHYMWDTVRGLAGAYLPERAIQYLAPRTLNKIVTALNIDFTLYANASRAEDYTELQKSVRRATRSIVLGD